MTSPPRRFDKTDFKVVIAIPWSLPVIIQSKSHTVPCLFVNNINVEHTSVACMHFRELAFERWVKHVKMITCILFCIDEKSQVMWLVLVCSMIFVFTDVLKSLSRSDGSFPSGPTERSLLRNGVGRLRASCHVLEMWMSYHREGRSALKRNNQSLLIWSVHSITFDVCLILVARPLHCNEHLRAFGVVCWVDLIYKSKQIALW